MIYHVIFGRAVSVARVITVPYTIRYGVTVSSRAAGTLKNVTYVESYA